MGQENDLILNLDRLHTTPLGVGRIRKNLSLDAGDVVAWCRQAVTSPHSRIERRGKNWYVRTADCELTVNAQSYTIITAHKRK